MAFTALIETWYQVGLAGSLLGSWCSDFGIEGRRVGMAARTTLAIPAMHGGIGARVIEEAPRRRP